MVLSDKTVMAAKSNSDALETIGFIIIIFGGWYAAYLLALEVTGDEWISRGAAVLTFGLGSALAFGSEDSYEGAFLGGCAFFVVVLVIFFAVYGTETPSCRDGSAPTVEYDFNGVDRLVCYDAQGRYSP